MRRVSKRGCNMSLLKNVMLDLESSVPLDASYKEHFLSGNYMGYMECHIESDWLLIYILTEDTVTFARTGTHSDLFK
jgi:mRNA interferase YafQ